MPFIFPVITGILAFMAFIFDPPIYGGLGMGRHGGGWETMTYIYIIIIII
jgi:hypothetical protein